MKDIKGIAIVVLLIALFWAVWDSRNKDASLERFKATETRLSTQMDSLTTLQREANLEALKALTELAKAKSAIQAQTLITDRYRYRYEALRNIAPAKLSDRQIDSTANALYPR